MVKPALYRQAHHDSTSNMLAQSRPMASLTPFQLAIHSRQSHSAANHCRRPLAAAAACPHLENPPCVSCRSTFSRAALLSANSFSAAASLATESAMYSSLMQSASRVRVLSRRVGASPAGRLAPAAPSSSLRLWRACRRCSGSVRTAPSFWAAMKRACSWPGRRRAGSSRGVHCRPATEEQHGHDAAWSGMQTVGGAVWHALQTEPQWKISHAHCRLTEPP